MPVGFSLRPLRMLPAALLLAGLWAATPVQAQGRLAPTLAPTLALPSSGDGFCATPTPPKSVLQTVQARLAASGGAARLPGGDLPPLIIPAAYHVITAENGTGGATEQQIVDQNVALNVAFQPWNIEFVLVSQQQVPNDDWYGVASITNDGVDNAAALAMKTALAVDPSTTLNLYFNDLPGGLYGYAQFPDTWPEDSPRWGVVMDNVTLPGSGDPFGGGNVGTHEVGHVLGLYHTFQDGCHADSQCASSGDLVCDTPAESSPNGFDQPCGVLRDSCPTSAGNDPVENYMDYSSPSCMIEFTAGQNVRMHDMLSTFKPAFYNAALATGVYFGPDALAFGDAFVGFPETQTVTLLNVTGAPLGVSAVTLPAGFSSDFGGPVTLADRGRLTLRITFDPETEGLFGGDVSIETSFAEQPTFTVAVFGTAAFAPDIDEPTAIEAALAQDETSEETFTFSNEGAGPLTWSLDGFVAARLAAEGRAMPAAPDAGLVAEELFKGQPNTQTGTPVRFGAGGPDLFGYTWIDSDEDGGPAFAFVDISGTGTPVSLGDDDSESAPLPFPFPFYGELYDAVDVVSNGFLNFGPQSTAYTNEPIPSPGTPDAFLAPFWDDLNPSDGGSIYYQDMADGRFVVQWDAVPFYTGPGTNTFQAILYADGRVLFQYESMGSGSATVGVESPDGADGLQVAYNTAYAVDGLAVLIAPPATWIADASPSAGTLAPGASMTVTVSLDAADLDTDLYMDGITIRSNDPDEPTKTVAVSLVVNAANAPAAPALLAPAAGASFQPASGASTVSVPLSWAASAGAESYDVEIAADAAFTDIVDSAAGFAGTAGDTEPLGLGTYFWHVRANGEEAQSPWSPTRQFVVVSGVAAEEDVPADVTALLGAFPNPLSRLATVRFALAQPADVALVVYDVLGQEVARLAAGDYPAGAHEATFHADGLAPGLYLVRFAADGVVQTRQVVVAR